MTPCGVGGRFWFKLRSCEQIKVIPVQYQPASISQLYSLCYSKNKWAKWNIWLFYLPLMLLADSWFSAGSNVLLLQILIWLLFNIHYHKKELIHSDDWYEKMSVGKGLCIENEGFCLGTIHFKVLFKVNIYFRNRHCVLFFHNYRKHAYV